MIPNFNKLNFLNIYLSFIFITFVLSIIFTHQLIQYYPDLITSNNNLQIKNIPFAYGDLIYNLVSTKQYVSYEFDIEMYLSRLPVLPLIISFFYTISKNIYFIVIVKNIILFSIFFYCAIIFTLSHKLQKKYLVLLLIIFLYNPYNLIVNLNFVYADFLVGVLVPSLFLICLSKNKNKYLISAIIIFILYLSKTNIFFLSLSLPFFMFIIEKNNKKFLPLVGLFLAVSVWSVFGFIKTDRIPFGPSLITINSWGMSHVLNKEFSTTYPQKTVDHINFKDKNKKFEKEWDFYDFYNQRNILYIKNNKEEFIENIFLKVKFIFTDIYVDGNQSNNIDTREIRFSSIFNKILFNTSLVILFYNFYKLLKYKKYEKIDLYFLIFITMYLFPLIVGWATSKHLAGIFITSKIYLVFKYLKTN
tara:strand:- start:3844 stop:5094 length:1251 start_codon:yes stop_codon:yes gene_type:complete